MAWRVREEAVNCVSSTYIWGNYTYGVGYASIEEGPLTQYGDTEGGKGTEKSTTGKSLSILRQGR